MTPCIPSSTPPRGGAHRARLNTSSKLLSLALIAAVACGKDDQTDTHTGDNGITFTGRVVASDGTQHSMNGRASIDMRSASRVDVFSVDEDGTTAPVATGDVSASGDFFLVASYDAGATDFALIETYDDEDRLVTAAIVEQSMLSDGDKRRFITDAETTIEALVWLDRVQKEGSASASDFTDIRTLIDARLAGAVYSEWERNEEANAEISALSSATDAALAARTILFADRGWNGDASDLYYGSADASQALNTLLFLSTSPSAQQDAWLTFYEDRDTAFALEGLDASDRVDGNSAAALAFRMVIETDASLSANIEDEADRSSAMYEAWSVSKVMADSSAEADLSATATAAATLWQDVIVAQDSGAIVQAYARIEGPTRLSMASMAEGNLGGISILVDELFERDIDGVLGAEFDVAVSSLVSDFETSSDVRADAAVVAEFWSDLRVSVRDLVEVSDLYGSSTIITASELMLHASGGHSAGF